MKRVTIRLDDDLYERTKNLVFWTPGMTLTEFFAEAVGSHVGQYERERGNQYPSRKNKKKRYV